MSEDFYDEMAGEDGDHAFNDDNYSASGRSVISERRGDKGIPAFLSKTYDILEDPTCSAFVKWNFSANGECSFSILKDKEFAKEVLPRYFKHNRLSSFVRQLNIYGFHKCGPKSWEFSHPNFIKGRRDLLHNIKRKDGSDHNRRQVLEDERRRNQALITELERRKQYDDNLQQELYAIKKQNAEMEHLLKNIIRGVATTTITGDTRGFSTARKRRRADLSLKKVSSNESGTSNSVSSLLNPESAPGSNDLDAGPTQKVAQGLAFSRSMEVVSESNSNPSRSIGSLLSDSRSSKSQSSVSQSSERSKPSPTPELPFKFPPEVLSYLKNEDVNRNMDSETLEMIIENSMGKTITGSQKLAVRQAVRGLMLCGAFSSGELSQPQTPPDVQSPGLFLKAGSGDSSGSRSSFGKSTSLRSTHETLPVSGLSKSNTTYPYYFHDTLDEPTLLSANMMAPGQNIMMMPATMQPYYYASTPPQDEVIDPNWSQVQAQLRAQLQLANQVQINQSMRPRGNEQQQLAANALLNLSETKLGPRKENSASSVDKINYDRGLPTIHEGSQDMGPRHYSHTDSSGIPLSHGTPGSSIQSVDNYNRQFGLIPANMTSENSSRASMGNSMGNLPDIEGSEFFQKPIWAHTESGPALASKVPAEEIPIKPDLLTPMTLKPASRSASDVASPDVPGLGRLVNAALSISGSTSSNMSLGNMESIGSISQKK